MPSAGHFFSNSIKKDEIAAKASAARSHSKSTPGSETDLSQKGVQPAWGWNSSAAARIMHIETKAEGYKCVYCSIGKNYLQLVL